MIANVDHITTDAAQTHSIGISSTTIDIDVVKEGTMQESVHNF